jgi:hypothetical protein
MAKLPDDQTPKSGAGQSATPASDPRTLSAPQIAALKSEAERYRIAQRQVTDALGVLWNAQLDLAIQLGQRDSVETALSGQRRIYDNCDC